MRGFTQSLAIASCLIIIVTFAAAQEKTEGKPMHHMANKAELSNAAYTAQALTAAPRAIAKDAGVVRMQEDGTMKTLRDSKNGFNCLIMMGNKMCGDANSMEFFNAMMKKQSPPDKLGITYMLAGDKGASNTDPTAAKKTADNHWVVTGPHIMIVGPAAKQLGVPDSADADPTKPFLMWANTPYAHAMIPVGGASHAAAAKTEAEMHEMKK
jgi:hypothetical protein